MDDVLSGDLIYISAFCLAGLAFALGPIILVHLISARKTRNYANKTQQYVECGMDPIGDAWIRYSAVYYLYALVFVAFAVDVLYLDVSNGAAVRANFRPWWRVLRGEYGVRRDLREQGRARKSRSGWGTRSAEARRELGVSGGPL